MKELFPRLEAIYDPNRKNDTRYGGAIILKRMWDYLDCDRLLSSAGIQKRSGIPASCLAFNYTLKPMMDAGSIKRTNTRTRDDQLLRALIPRHDQSTLNRFLNGPHYWEALNHLRIQKLQKRRRTRALEDGLIVLDDVVIENRREEGGDSLRLGSRRRESGPRIRPGRPLLHGRGEELPPQLRLQVEG